jgi:hypothetical protein
VGYAQSPENFEADIPVSSSVAWLPFQCSFVDSHNRLPRRLEFARNFGNAGAGVQSFDDCLTFIRI